MIEMPFSYCGSVSIRKPDIKKAVTIRFDRDSKFLLQYVTVEGCPEAVVKFQFDEMTPTYNFETKAMYLGLIMPAVLVKDKLTITFKVPHIPWWKFWRRYTNIYYILRGTKVYEDKSAA